MELICHLSWKVSLIKILISFNNAIEAIITIYTYPGHELPYKGTGSDNKGILENLTMLATNDNIRDKITVRIPLIKDYNDTKEVIDNTVEFCDKNNLRKVTLLPYHTLGVSKSERIGQVANLFEPPSKDRINEIRAAFEGRDIVVEVLGE